MANPLRKTMVYLGLADEEYDDVMPSAPVAPVSRQDRIERQDQPKRAEVTPLRRPVASRHAAPAGMNEILTVHPRQYKDAQMIAQTFGDHPAIASLGWSIGVAHALVAPHRDHRAVGRATRQ